MGPGDVCRAGRGDPHSPHCARGHSPAPPWSWPGLQPCALRLSRSAAFQEDLRPSLPQASGPTPSWCQGGPDGSVEQGLMKREVGGLPCGRKSPRGAIWRSCPPREDPCLPPRQWQTLSHSQLGCPRLGASAPLPSGRGPRGLPGGSTCQGLASISLVASPPAPEHSTPKLLFRPAAHDIRT